MAGLSAFGLLSSVSGFRKRAPFKNLYPYQPPPLNLVVVEQRLDPGNAQNDSLPLHTSWVLALYWIMQPLGRLVPGVALVFKVLMLFYVLVCRHYVMDILGP